AGLSRGATLDRRGPPPRRARPVFADGSGCGVPVRPRCLGGAAGLGGPLRALRRRLGAASVDGLVASEGGCEMRRALRRSALLLIVAAATSSCTGSDEAEPTAALPPGVIAQVADTPISAELVREIVGATGREAESVVRDLVRGELFTSYVGAEEPSLLRVAERAAYARALLDAMRADALRSGGPITAREVDELTRARWVELSRPRSVRTAHAVALPRAPEHRDAARALAERMKDAVEGIVDPNEFADRVRAVDEEHGSPTAVEVRVEALPPVA